MSITNKHVAVYDPMDSSSIIGYGTAVHISAMNGEFVVIVEDNEGYLSPHKLHLVKVMHSSITKDAVNRYKRSETYTSGEGALDREAVGND